MGKCNKKEKGRAWGKYIMKRKKKKFGFLHLLLFIAIIYFSILLLSFLFGVFTAVSQSMESPKQDKARMKYETALESFLNALDNGTKNNKPIIQTKTWNKARDNFIEAYNKYQKCKETFSE